MAEYVVAPGVKLDWDGVQYEPGDTFNDPPEHFVAIGAVVPGSKPT